MNFTWWHASACIRWLWPAVCDQCMRHAHRSFCDAPEQIELVIRAHVGQIGHAIGEAEEGTDCANIPDVLVRKASLMQRLHVRLRDFMGALRYLDGEIQHQLLTPDRKSDV